MSTLGQVTDVATPFAGDTCAGFKYQCNVSPTRDIARITLHNQCGLLQEAAVGDLHGEGQVWFTPEGWYQQ